MFLQFIFFGIIIFFLTRILYLLSSVSKFKLITEQIGSSKGPLVLFTLFDVKEFLYKWPKIIKNPVSKSVFAWFGPLPIFITYNQIFIQKLLLSPDCQTKSSVLNVLKKELGLGLLTTEGSMWSRHRKLLNPAFNHRVLMKIFPIFNTKSSMFVKELENFVGTSEVNLSPIILKFVMKTSFETLVDFELKDDCEEHVSIMGHLIRFLMILMHRSSSVMQSFDLVFRFTKLYHPYEESKMVSFAFLQKLLRDKIKETRTIEEHSIDIRKSDKCFLQQAIDIHLNDNFSFTELFEEFFIIIAAGFETSANALHSVLLMLAMHPQYQEKLFEEVVSLYPDKEFNVRYEDIENFVYMNRFINETFRVTSTVPAIGRLATKDIQLSEDLVIPSGTSIVIDFFNMHRDKDIWGPNAEHFNPDNFLPENLMGKKSCSFLPFSKGPRNCIGWRYAEYFLKSSLAKIVRNYRFKTSLRYEDLHFLVNITVEYKVQPTMEVSRR